MYSYYPGTPRRDARAEHEKAWKRAEATAWDGKWHALSTEARRVFLDQIKPTVKAGAVQSSTPSDRLNAKVVDELAAAGFVKVDPPVLKKPGRVFPSDRTFDFAARVRALHRNRPLGATDRPALIRFIKYAFYDSAEPTINGVLQDAEIFDLVPLEMALENYVTSARWPGWAADVVGTATARALVEALGKAPGPVPLVDVPGLVPSATERDVRVALDGLIANLGVFEDLDPKSLDLVVGLLPVVRARKVEASRPRALPPLIVCERPAQVAPLSGLCVNDLRVFLLEVAGQAPRLRQDGMLFVKEEPRFLAALPEWPDWVHEALDVEHSRRVDDAFNQSLYFGFAKREQDERMATLVLTGKGRAWLASGLEDQYGTIYETFRAVKAKPDPYAFDDTFGDAKFLGVSVAIFPTKGRGVMNPSPYRDALPEQRQALREAIDRALKELKVGVFYRLDSVLSYLSFADRNPLNRATAGEPNDLFLARAAVPRLPEKREEAGRRLLSAFTRMRLVPFDALRLAIDNEGSLCIARLSRCDGYFGRPYDRGEEAASAETRVIVQPDFSVIVIGLHPAPAAELAPFCERASGQAGQGAMTFKITRASVVRAASQGLSASKIVARLKKHASVEVPENVLHEVHEWAGWIKLVNVRPMTVVRCPDREAADRVAHVFGRRAERLGETTVALDSAKLSPAERQKLQDGGVIITKDEITVSAPAPAPAPAPSPVPEVSAGPAVAAKKPRGRPKKAR